MRDDQNLWNFFFGMVFVGFVVLAIGLLLRHQVMPTSIELFDAVLITLATFRVIRLFVYDKITQWLRDLFLQKVSTAGSPGELVVVRQKFTTGPFRTISDLMSCPWCFGVWAAFVVSFFYFLTPLAWYPIFFMAIAGVASLVQVLANLIGWYAEGRKHEVEGR